MTFDFCIKILWHCELTAIEIVCFCLMCCGWTAVLCGSFLWWLITWLVSTERLSHVALLPSCRSVLTCIGIIVRVTTHLFWTCYDLPASFLKQWELASFFKCFKPVYLFLPIYVSFKVSIYPQFERFFDATLLSQIYAWVRFYFSLCFFFLFHMCGKASCLTRQFSL